MRRGLGVLVSPRLIPLHLLGLAATVAALMLGLWQLEAWQAQRAAEARDLTSAAPVPLAEALAPDQAFPSDAVGRPVELSGQWLPEGSFYATGREHEGRDGVWAVTPVAVCAQDTACDEAPALLVVRGWASDPGSAPAPPTGRVSVTGWLQPPEGSGRPDPDPRDDRLPEVRIADAIQRVDQDLYSAFLITDTADPAASAVGFEPLTPASLPDPGGDAGLRNFLYAAEWWVFGAFAVFVWWRWAGDEVERARRRETKTTPARAGAEGPA